MSVLPFPGHIGTLWRVTKGFVFLIQTGFPSRDDNPSCGYSRVDFDSDEDFNLFFNCEYYRFSFT